MDREADRHIYHDHCPLIISSTKTHTRTQQNQVIRLSDHYSVQNSVLVVTFHPLTIIYLIWVCQMPAPASLPVQIGDRSAPSGGRRGVAVRVASRPSHLRPPPPSVSRLSSALLPLSPLWRCRSRDFPCLFDSKPLFDLASFSPAFHCARS
jgi:hypothetical protein